jgi:hypothetical protein
MYLLTINQSSFVLLSPLLNLTYQADGMLMPVHRQAFHVLGVMHLFVRKNVTL